MYIYVYMYTHMYVCSTQYANEIYINPHICTYKCNEIYIYTRVYIYIYIYIVRNMPMALHGETNTLARQTHSITPARRHTQTHAHTHTHLYINKFAMHDIYTNGQTACECRDTPFRYPLKHIGTHAHICTHLYMHVCTHIFVFTHVYIVGCAICQGCCEYGDATVYVCTYILR